MELEGGSEAGNSHGSTLGVYILRVVLTFADRSCYSVDHCSYCVQNWKEVYGECIFIICELFMPTRCCMSSVRN